MNFLLDTHAFLWFLEGNQELSSKARENIENPENTKFISIASIWELAIKTNLGKLQLEVSLEDLKGAIIVNHFEILPLDFEHIIGRSKLPDFHKDPFDRIIIAQAMTENCIVLSKDASFSLYKGIQLIW
ncbi:MAG: PIN domain nuclease [Sphingobacteriaceae bacterium]|nr:PIN domain nuclease [Sphingobacteriaceae bacterium]